MRYVTATDAKQRLAALLDAAQRDVAVLLSPHEYDRLRAFNTAEFQRFCDRVAGKAAVRGLTPSKLKQIFAGE